jgi:hypothetical protein
MSANILYTVFAPTAALSRTRWNYYQHEDGSITHSITGPKFGESQPTALAASEVFPNALAWARCLHDGKPHFENCREGDEIYSALCNVKLHVEAGRDDLARICLDGIVEDCQEWKRRLEKREVAA